MAQAKTAAARSLPVDPSLGDAAEAVAKVAAIIKSKPWHQSLTVQGALVAAAGAGVVVYGPAVLSVTSLTPAAATQVAEGVSGVLASIGALMSLIGRLRLGGLS